MLPSAERCQRSDVKQHREAVSVTWRTSYAVNTQTRDVCMSTTTIVDYVYQSIYSQCMIVMWFYASQIKQLAVSLHSATTTYIGQGTCHSQQRVWFVKPLHASVALCSLCTVDQYAETRTVVTATHHTILLLRLLSTKVDNNLNWQIQLCVKSTPTAAAAADNTLLYAHFCNLPPHKGSSLTGLKYQPSGRWCLLKH